jgi:hypothetical protein
MKTVREAMSARVDVKSDATIAEKREDPSVALSGAVKKRRLATDAAASGLRKPQEILSLRSPTRRPAWSKLQRLLGKRHPKRLLPARAFLPTSSLSARWRLCSSLANKAKHRVAREQPSLMARYELSC